MQVVVASLNEKNTEDSSSNKDSAVKSDKEDIQGSVDDVQESVKRGVQEANKEARGDEAVTPN